MIVVLSKPPLLLRIFLYLILVHYFIGNDPILQLRALLIVEEDHAVANLRNQPSESNLGLRHSLSPAAPVQFPEHLMRVQHIITINQETSLIFAAFASQLQQLAVIEHLIGNGVRNLPDEMRLLLLLYHFYLVLFLQLEANLIEIQFPGNQSLHYFEVGEVWGKLGLFQPLNLLDQQRHVLQADILFDQTVDGVEFRTLDQPHIEEPLQHALQVLLLSPVDFIKSVEIIGTAVLLRLPLFHFYEFVHPTTKHASILDLPH